METITEYVLIKDGNVKVVDSVEAFANSTSNVYYLE